MNLRRVLSLLAALWLLPTTGCLFTAASQKVIRQGEPLYEVTFQSPVAEQTFVNCVAHPAAANAGQSGSFVGVPFLFAWAKSEKLSKNAIYNDQVVLCDTDGNGLITDAEALQFRDRYYPTAGASSAVASDDDDDDDDLEMPPGLISIQATHTEAPSKETKPRR